jgi:hypothetical protein
MLLLSLSTGIASHQIGDKTNGERGGGKNISICDTTGLMICSYRNTCVYIGYKVSLKINTCVRISIEQHNITKCHFLDSFMPTDLLRDRYTHVSSEEQFSDSSCNMEGYMNQNWDRPTFK